MTLDKSVSGMDMSTPLTPGTRIEHHPYGRGTVVEQVSTYLTIVRFDRADGFHGNRPLIVPSYQLTVVPSTRLMEWMPIVDQRLGRNDLRALALYLDAAVNIH